jgi:hypothetical protein
LLEGKAFHSTPAREQHLLASCPKVKCRRLSWTGLSPAIDFEQRPRQGVLPETARTAKTLENKALEQNGVYA